MAHRVVKNILNYAEIAHSVKYDSSVVSLVD